MFLLDRVLVMHWMCPVVWSTLIKVQAILMKLLFCESTNFRETRQISRPWLFHLILSPAFGYVTQVFTAIRVMKIWTSIVLSSRDLSALKMEVWNWN